MIEGIKKENTGDFGTKKVGLVEVKVIAINPDEEQFKELLGIELKEDSKETEYLGESSDGNTFLRINVWVEEVNKNKEDLFRKKITFYLENKERENKDLTKKQYINSIGVCSWANDPNYLPNWFKERDYRVAFSGEEDLYNFMRTWLGNLDYRNAETTLQLEWKKLMKGNIKELRDQINGEYVTNSKTGLPLGIVVAATISTKEKDGEVKEYQGIYNRGFLSSYSLKHFRLTDYSDDKILQNLRIKEQNLKNKVKNAEKLKDHEKFVLQITNSEYGCKDFYSLKDIHDYDSSDNLVASDKIISSDSSEY